MDVAGHYADDEQQKQSGLPVNTAGHVAETINEWILHQLEITNMEEMLDDLGLTGNCWNNNGGECNEKDVQKLHQILKGFNVDLQNIYDNYVCFNGERDCGQMQRFRDSAYQRAKQAWEASDLASKKGFSEKILSRAATKLFKLYDHHNNIISEKEKKLVEGVVGKIEMHYMNRLNIYYTEAINGKGRRRGARDEFEAIHRRMVTQCIGIVGRIMNYGGKLNNVVREATENMQRLLTDRFESSASSADDDEQDFADLRNRIEIYQVAMTKWIKENNAYDPDMLKREHEMIVRKFANGLEDQNRTNELATLLDAYFLNEIERRHHQEDQLGPQPPSFFHICIYLTFKWAWVVAFTKKDSTVTIQPKGSKDSAGFPAVCGRLKTGGGGVFKLCQGNAPNLKFVWGHEASKMFDEKREKLEVYDYIFNFVRCTGGDGRMAKTNLTNLFQTIKSDVETCLKEKFCQQATLIIPSWFTFQERTFLRDVCQDTGFKKVVLLSQSSVSAQTLFMEGIIQQDKLVVVVYAGEDGIRMEIFSGQSNGVHLNAVTTESWPKCEKQDGNSSIPNPYPSETIKATYERALTQLPSSKRNSVVSYIPISEYPVMKTALEEYFDNAENLVKAESINGKTLIKTFHYFVNDAVKVGQFVEVLATIQTTETQKVAGDDKMDEGTTKDRKGLLLEKCERMEKQLEDGSVAVGKLTRKIILEAIMLGRLAAAEDMVAGSEAKDVEELFNLHNFN